MLLEEEEESTARDVAVWGHVEGCRELSVEGGERSEVVAGEEGSGGDGDGFVACGEESPAVGGAFGDPERFVLMEVVEDGEVVDVAMGAFGESEARRGGWGEVSVLDAGEVAEAVEVWDLQPIGAVMVAPGGEPAPADDARVEEALIEEEVESGRREERVLEEVSVASCVEGGGVECVSE